MVADGQCNFAKRVKDLEIALANSQTLVGQWEKSFLEQWNKVIYLEAQIEAYAKLDLIP